VTSVGGPDRGDAELGLRTQDDLRSLYGENTPAKFWQLTRDVSADIWDSAVRAAATVLPGGSEALARHGLDGLLEHVLGEGQFGPGRYRLSRAKQFYYELRPLVPRSLTRRARHMRSKGQASSYPLRWPIEDRYVQFLYQVLSHVSAAAATCATATLGDGAAPGRLQHRSLWPYDARFAFVLTHDIERAEGQQFARTLADMDERYGFRSAFNFVLEDYAVDSSLVRELQQRGFEVGLHGLKHDGKLYASRAAFDRSARRINWCLQEWGAAGFRSPSTHRNPEWMQALEIQYDSSFFDTDPFEIMLGGTMSIWPFFCGHFVELPYTLLQDHTLLAVLGERTPKLWVDKVDFIAQWSGMALVNVHPDYMRYPAHRAVYEEFLQEMAGRVGQAGVLPADSRPCWHALPREVASWWRERAEAGLSGR